MPGCAAAAGPDDRARAWRLYVLRFQVGLVYTCAGLAKLQGDWLLEAQPLNLWLASLTDLPVLGPLLALPAAPYVAAWAGFLFDSTVALFLSLAPHPRRSPSRRCWCFTC